ncbi:hypothetical protein [Streptomyces canus]|uniref:hypothetical protein n=1 Tax=Streptomyces canus TaxID=58343 RepID=UPI00382C49B8
MTTDTTPPQTIEESAEEPAAGQSTPSVASIAKTVGTAMAQAAAAAQPSRPADAEEIQAIADAIVRLLVGVPMRSDGQLTIKSLAAEAGLKRNKLTHKHTGLKDLFYALVSAQDARPKIADHLKQQNDDLKEKLARVRTERDQLKTDVQQLARVVHVLEVENHQLRQSADNNGVVRVLPLRPPPRAD